MFKPTSPKPLPKQGDPRKFAQQGIHLEGFVSVADLPRLAESVEETDTRLDVELNFRVDEEKNRIVIGKAQGELTFICQRCLENLKVNVVSDIKLAAVWDEEHAQSLPESLDPWIVGEGPADFYSMIEEEMLLNLPHVIYHETLCIDKKLFSSGEAVVPEKKQNPFQVLEQLKSSPKN